MLYFRLGSFDVARSYLEQAQASEGSAGKAADRAAVYLAATEQAEDPASIAGAVIVGARFQSNANAGPNSWFVTYRFPSPIENVPFDWAIDLKAGYIRRQYDEPDPTVSPALAQRDNEGWLRAILTVPVREDVALARSGELHRQQSN